METEYSWGWKAGAAQKAVGATVLALVLGGFVAPMVVEGIARVAEAMGVSPDATRLATSKETKSLLARVQVEMEREAPKEVGEAIQARLVTFGSLPRAHISVVQGREPSSSSAFMASSFAVVEAGGEACPVVVVVDAAGQATLPRVLPKTMGLAPGEGLSKRLTDFELLHELGHCAAQQSRARFDHPDLEEKQNKLIFRALRGTEAAELWGESYADAYAGLSQMEEAKFSPKRSAQARSDLEVVLEWRKMGRLRRVAVGVGQGQDKLIVEQGAHVTEMTLQALLSEPRWLESNEPIAKRAAQLASIGLARTLAATASPQGASEKFTKPKERLLQELGNVAQSFRQDIAKGRKEKESREGFIKREGAVLARRFKAGGEVVETLGPKSMELAAVAWDIEARADAERLELGGKPGEERELNEEFARSFRKIVAEWGFVDKLAEAPGMQRMEERAKKAWAQVSKHEARHVPAVDDPRPEAMARASKSEQAGEGLLIKGFYHDVADPQVSKSQLDQWRGARRAETAAAAPKVPSARKI